MDKRISDAFTNLAAESDEQFVKLADIETRLRSTTGMNPLEASNLANEVHAVASKLKSEIAIATRTTPDPAPSSRHDGSTKAT